MLPTSRFRAAVLVGTMVACGGGSKAPADAVAVFDGGWVSPDELAAAASGQRAGTRQLAGGPAASPEELVRWIAWEKLVADSRRSDVVGRRDFLLRARELECGQLVPPVLAELESGVQISDEEIEAELESARARMAAEGPRLEIRHIFLRASDDVTAEERARKLALAERLHDELQRGADFAALARQHSESATAPNGGLIPGVRLGMTDPAFERVVVAMKEGEISDVIETASGYHIVRLEKRSGLEPVDQQALRSQLPQQLSRRKAAQAKAELLAGLKKTVPNEARWNEDGVIDPRSGDGAVLVVKDFVYTAEDLRTARARAGAALERGDQIRAFLDQLLERELLAAEAVRRFEPSREELEAQRGRARETALVELALDDEQADLAASISRAELERFAAEQPAQLQVPATYRPQVIFLPDGRNVWETFREAERMVAELRGGADFAALARERSAGPNADLGGELGLRTADQLMAYDLELLRTVVELEAGGISDPVRIPENRLSSQPETLPSGFLIVKLLERQEPRTLDLAADERELRQRYWAGHRTEILRQRRDERLLAADFQVREVPPVAPAFGTPAALEG